MYLMLLYLLIRILHYALSILRFGQPGTKIKFVNNKKMRKNTDPGVDVFYFVFDVSFPGVLIFQVCLQIPTMWRLGHHMRLFGTTVSEVLIKLPRLTQNRLRLSTGIYQKCLQNIFNIKKYSII
jgi:hypothetical protein